MKDFEIKLTTQEYNYLMQFMCMAKTFMDGESEKTFPHIDFWEDTWEELRKKLVEYNKV